MYHNSLTEQTMCQINRTWENELRDTELLLESATREKIFDFLNAKENLCTADFILRRQIQIQLPELVRQAADGLNFADLTKSGNVPWATELVERLSSLLANKNFRNVKNLNLDRRQWTNILRGNALCNRASAIKLIFALDMDEPTAVKFLVANGKPTFSTRNPFDYLCNFCRKAHLTYDDAVDLLAKFETQRTAAADEKFFAPTEFATDRLENETQKISDDATLSPSDKQSQILKYMLENQSEFVAKVERKDRNGQVRRADYPSGFSLANEQKLKILLKYLTKFYPQFLQWKELNEFDSILLSKAVKINADGSPKNPEQLIQAMREAQEIFLWEEDELSEIGLPTGNERDNHGKRLLKDKQRYDAIPFNGAILLPLKNLSKTLRANLRANEHPDNAEEVDRSTILFLAYFFICGCLAPNKNLDALAQTLDDDIADEERDYINDLLFALKAVVTNAESVADADNPVQLYVDSLNELLDVFDCSKFYAPFVIDKCILLCLLTLQKPQADDDYPLYLLNLLIEESYRLSKKILEAT